MSLTILASVSLLTLVSSARPVQPYQTQEDGLQSFFYERNENVRQAIQAVIKTHASPPEDPQHDSDISVRLATVEQLQAFLSTAQGDTVKALIPLDAEVLHSPDEKELYGPLSRLEEDHQLLSVPDEALDTVSVMSPASSSTGLPDPIGDFKSQAIPEGHADTFATPLVVILVGSCALALMAVGCIALFLYITEVLRRSAFQSLQGFLSHAPNNLVTTSEQSKVALSSPRLITDLEKALSIDETCIEYDTARKSTEDREEFQVADSPGPASSYDDVIVADEEAKSLDQESGVVPLSTIPSPARLVAEPPPFLPQVETFSDDIAVPGGLPLRGDTMQELDTPRPSWSLRASEASALLRASDERERRRGYGQFTVPGLDAALAMQLRPGFGMGADAAWLVRFVMALFGWCAILMSGSDRSN